MTITVSPVGGKMRPDELRDADLVVLEKSQQIVEEPAPPPYTTATLLEDAVLLPGWSAGKVMQVAQLLFEQGLITYPRTDSTYISPEAADDLRKVAGLLFGGDVSLRVTVQQTGAHEAVRPTSPARLPDELPVQYQADERTLYRIIWQRAIAACLKPARYRITTVLFDVE